MARSFTRAAEAEACRFLAALKVEPMGDRLAKEVGIAMAKVRSATQVDTTVMALASGFGAIVYTSDPDDLARLRAHFSNVRIRSVSPNRSA